MKTHLTIVSILFLSGIISLHAQTPKFEAEPGFAVSAKGDTLFGMVNYMKKSGYRQSMQVKVDEQTSKMVNARNYLYVKAGKEVFESFQVPGGEDKQFFWQKTGGKVFLYEYQYELYQLNTMVTKTEYYARKAGKDELVKLGPGNYKKKIGEWISDNPALVQKLEDKETKFEDLEAILVEYNKIQ